MSKEIRLSGLACTTVPSTERGILINGLYYSCGLAIQNGWFSNSKKNVQIFYHPDDLRQIYISDDENLVIAYALNPIQIPHRTEVEEYQKQLNCLKEQLKQRRKNC